MTMDIGDAILLRSIKSEKYDKQGKWAASFTYRAPKGRAFMVLLLAQIDTTKPEEFNTEPGLNALGWYFCNDCQVKAGQAEAGAEGAAP